MTPVEVFVAAAAECWHATQDLRACDAISLASTPRHATVLLVAGSIAGPLRVALDRVHDQMPHPRGVVMWDDPTRGPDTVDVAVTAILERAATLSDLPSSSSPDRLDDVEPNEWRGVGPFGQGGEGMMGGTPYGRPMAMTADDRDGLSLDQLRLRLGPFLTQFPAGFDAEVTLQGDVIQSVDLGWTGDTLLVSADRNVGVTRGLRWLSHALHVQGLDALAARAAGLARRSTDIHGDPTLSDDFLRLRRRLRWTGLPLALRGVGELDGVDTWTRWLGHLDAVSSALDAQQLQMTTSADVRSITGSEVAAALVGMTLSDAVSTVVSFDIDVPTTERAGVES